MAIHASFGHLVVGRAFIDPFARISHAIEPTSRFLEKERFLHNRRLD
jgi:hypothetical protein